MEKYSKLNVPQKIIFWLVLVTIFLLANCILSIVLGLFIYVIFQTGTLYTTMQVIFFSLIIIQVLLFVPSLIKLLKGGNN